VSTTQNRSTALSLVLFFLKTFFFNPLNNPVFVVAAIVIIFFYVEGSLDKYQIALILYLSILSHYFVGNVFTDSRPVEEKSSRVPIRRYFQALPLSGKRIYFSYLSSSVIYVVLIYVALGLLLTHVMKLPNLKHMQFIQSVTPGGDTITTVTGTAFTPRGIPYSVSIVLDTSLLFDPVLKMGGGRFWVSLYYVMTFLYISVFQVFRQFGRTSHFSLMRLFHTLPLILYLLLGLTFVSELLLSQREMGICIRFLFQHVDMTISLFLGTIIVTSLSILLMSKTITNRLKDL